MNYRYLAVQALLAMFVFSFLTYADEPEYMLVNIDGQKCGYGIMERQQKGDIVETSQTVKLTINRMGFTMEVLEKTLFTETVEGKPLGFVTEQKFSNAPAQVIKGKVDGGKMIVMRTGENRSTVSFDPDSLMPEGLRLLALEKGMEPGSVFEVKVFDAALVQTLPAKIEIFDKEKIDLLGRVKELYKVVTTTTIPGAGDVRETSYADEQAKVYKTSTWLMGMTIEMIACEKEVALSPDSPADIFSGLLLNSPEEIPAEALDEPITYKLKIKPEARDTQVPSDDNQQVTYEDGFIIITVDPVRDVKKEAVPVSYDAEDIKEYLAANGYIQSDDKKIKELAKKAVGDAKDSLTAAHNIERFVHGYISQKNLSAGYSTAIEILESREGDCTEHAILTAALCRASGIPARAACGVVYAEQFANNGNIFGGHAWTECYVGGKWIGLDATIGRDGYGSGHIKLAEGDGRPEDFFSLVNLLGNFEIVDIKY